MAAKTKVASIQAGRRTGHKSRVALLNDECKRRGWNVGAAWSDDDVSELANMIGKDATTYEMALTLGRSYYATQSARSHVRFAMNHAEIFRRLVRR